MMRFSVSIKATKIFPYLCFVAFAQLIQKSVSTKSTKLLCRVILTDEAYLALAAGVFIILIEK